MPDTSADWWNTSDVAAHLGVTPSTVSRRRSSGDMPPPDQSHGRIHLWRPSTITGWTKPPAGTGSATPATGVGTADPDADWWTTNDIATYLGISPSALSMRKTKGQFPASDHRNGRIQLWRPATVIAWHALTHPDVDEPDAAIRTVIEAAADSLGGPNLLAQRLGSVGIDTSADDVRRWVAGDARPGVEALAVSAALALGHATDDTVRRLTAIEARLNVVEARLDPGAEMT